MGRTVRRTKRTKRPSKMRSKMRSKVRSKMRSKVRSKMRSKVRRARKSVKRSSKGLIQNLTETLSLPDLSSVLEYPKNKKGDRPVIYSDSDEESVQKKSKKKKSKKKKKKKKTKAWSAKLHGKGTKGKKGKKSHKKKHKKKKMKGGMVGEHPAPVDETLKKKIKDKNFSIEELGGKLLKYEDIHQKKEEELDKIKGGDKGIDDIYRDLYTTEVHIATLKSLIEEEGGGVV